MSRRAVALACVALALLFHAPVLAWAHASLVSADPAAGSRLRAMPPRVRLVFSEPIEPALGRISLVGSDGVVLRLAAGGDPRDVHALVAPVGPLASGAYRLDWRVVSADGHPIEGHYTFRLEQGVDSGAAPAVPTPPPVTIVPPADAPAASEIGESHGEDRSAGWGPTLAGAPVVPAALRGVAVGTLMAATGLLVFLSFSREERDSSDRRPERAATWLSVAAVPLLVLHHSAWALNAMPEHRLGYDMLSAMLTTNVGRAELWRTGLALLAAWALAIARRPRLALPFAVAALLVSGATGHSATIQPGWTTPAKAVHLLAGAVWLGGLLWLLALVRGDAARFARESGRVSSAAFVAVLLVTASGLLQTFLFLPEPLDLFRSAYGVVALAKIGGLAILVGFGAHHRFRVIPRLSENPGLSTGFAVTLRRELVVMTLVVVLGGLLGYVPTPAAPQVSPSHALAR